MNKQAAAGALVLALCLVTMGTQATCVVKNQSTQPVLITPAVHGVAVALEVAVGASVVLPLPLQHCYITNKHSGHKKGPVALAGDGIYIIVEALVVGEVNLCVGTVLGGILNIGAVVLAGI